MSDSSQQEKKIDVVITSYERWEFTKECLNKLHEHTTYPIRVIVIDNGSSPDTQTALAREKEDGRIDTLILLDKNYGLEPAKNLALNFVSSEYHVDSDNDILVAPVFGGNDWLSKLLDLYDGGKYIAVACRPQVFIGADQEAMFKDSPPVLERDFVGGSMRLMNTQAVRDVGGWRSNPKDMNEANRGEEKYICGKLKAAGHKVGYARDVPCFHMFGEDEWGYNGVEHYHRDQWPVPTDKMYGTKEKWYENFALG